MSSAHEKTLPKQLTAQELAEGERLSLERQKNGHERSVEEYLSKVESFVHRASKPELLKFITIVLSGSPEAQKEFNQLKGYYNGQFEKLLQEGNTRIINKSANTPSAVSTNVEKPKSVEVQSQAPKWTPKQYEQTGTINGNSVTILSQDVYTALQSYKTNPERLTRIVASGELSAMNTRRTQARRELEEQKIHIVNSGNYPQ